MDMLYVVAINVGKYGKRVLCKATCAKTATLPSLGNSVLMYLIYFHSYSLASRHGASCMQQTKGQNGMLGPRSYLWTP